MKTVTLQVATLEEVKRRAQDAFRGKKQGVRISFTTRAAVSAHDCEALGTDPFHGWRRTADDP